MFPFKINTPIYVFICLFSKTLFYFMSFYIKYLKSRYIDTIFVLENQTKILLLILVIEFIIIRAALNQCYFSIIGILQFIIFYLFLFY